MRGPRRRVLALLAVAFIAWGSYELFREREPSLDDDWGYGDELAAGRESGPDGTLLVGGGADGPRLRGRRRAPSRTLFAEILAWAKDALGLEWDDRRRVTVLVVDASDGATPLHGATVWAVEQAGDGAVTDIRGLATVPTAQEGRAVLSVSHPGRVARVVGVPEDAPAPFLVPLARGLVLHGAVLWSDGAPVEGARVTRGGREVPLVETEADGRFEFSGLDGDLERVDVVVVRDGDAYAATVYGEPGAGPLEVRLPSEPTRRALTLLVVDGVGRPVPGARVAGRGADGFEVGEGGTADAEGRWTSRPDPRTRWLVVAPPDAGKEASKEGASLAPVLVEVRPDLAGTVTLALPAPAAVSGWVTDREGRPLPDAEVTVSFRRAGLGPHGLWEYEASASAGRDGSFEVTDVPPGDVRIEITAEGHEAVDLVEHTAPVDALRVALGPRRGPYRIEGAVRDTAGRGVPGAAVRWRPVRGPGLSDGSRVPWFRVLADARGSYEIMSAWEEVVLRAGLPQEEPGVMEGSERRWRPGEGRVDLVITPRDREDLVVRVEGLPPDADPLYATLTVWSRGSTIPRWHEQVLVDGDTARFRRLAADAVVNVAVGPLPDGRVGWAEGVSVRAGTVTVRLEPTDTIRGRVLVSGGTRPLLAVVRGAAAATTTFDPEGRFVLPLVPPGDHEVVVVAHDPGDPEGMRRFGAARARAGDEGVVVTPTTLGPLFPD